MPPDNENKDVGQSHMRVSLHAWLRPQGNRTNSHDRISQSVWMCVCACLNKQIFAAIESSCVYFCPKATNEWQLKIILHDLSGERAPKKRRKETDFRGAKFNDCDIFPNIFLSSRPEVKETLSRANSIFFTSCGRGEINFGAPSHLRSKK